MLVDGPAYYCFARDVTEAMLVENDKHFSTVGTKLHFLLIH